jgi:hypothetical protein
MNYLSFHDEEIRFVYHVSPAQSNKIIFDLKAMKSLISPYYIPHHHFIKELKGQYWQLGQCESLCFNWNWINWIFD